MNGDMTRPHPPRAERWGDVSEVSPNIIGAARMSHGLSAGRATEFFCETLVLNFKDVVLNLSADRRIPADDNGEGLFIDKILQILG